ncbi:NB-ARC - like 10 [Theobroma cacao]|nr:NB-ARC - like 10 [Theobroma cacao]
MNEYKLLIIEDDKEYLLDATSFAPTLVNKEHFPYQIPNVKEKVHKNTIKKSRSKFFSILDPKKWLKNCKSSYNFGKQVTRKLTEIVDLKNAGVFERVAENELAAQVDVRPVGSTVGLERTFDEVWRLLEQNNVGSIGLHGLGGVGKTTLLTQINNKLSNDLIGYDVVIWVVVSKDHNIEKVQEKIGEKVGLSHNETWKNKSFDEKAIEIWRVLSKKKFFLLLDDVWERVDLIKVGIPEPDQENGSKLIFTTRFLAVCGQMGAHKVIKVECLSKDDAWKLFKDKVGEETLDSHLEIRGLAKQVVDECEGLPLALITIGRAMAYKMTPKHWEYAIKVLQEFPHKLASMDKKVLYPEDFEIPIDELKDYWFCEGFLDEFDNIIDARMQGEDIINSLLNACLLERCKDSAECVKMHDVIRDMTLWIACECEALEKRFFVKTGLRAIKAFDVENWEGVISDGFFQFMCNLRVLNLSSNYLLKELPQGISELISLECLDLHETYISELPIQLNNCRSLRNLTWLMFAPNLTQLEVAWCERMKEIIGEVSEVANVVGISNPSPFAKLERLHLETLLELKSIYWDALQFPCLREIIVLDCPKLKKLPLNCDSAKGNQISIVGNEEWWKQIFVERGERGEADSLSALEMSLLGWPRCSPLHVLLPIPSGMGVFESIAENELAVQVDVRPAGSTVGLERIFDKVWCLLEQNDVGIIGLHGLGGVGKTTLLTQINNKLSNELIGYDLVIWVVVSKDHNIETVQEKIGENLGLSRGETWKNKSFDKKAVEIWRVLSRKKFVLLLDDVWERVDLIKVGIPEPDQKNGSKLIFTTRSLDVCGQMGAHKVIKVECLSQDDAWKLFEEKVGEETLDSHPDIRELAKQVADECAGLPLALITIGRAMAYKTMPKHWEYAIMVLKEFPHKLASMDKEVLPNDTMRSCLLYCSLYSEDFAIPIDELKDYWFYEGFLDEFNNIIDARMQGEDIINSLLSACLLERCEYTTKYVKMHDVIRDMALWIAHECEAPEKRFFVRTSTKAPDVEKLENWEGVISDGFFQFMRNLRVLNLSSNQNLHELPLGISELVSLECLDLRWTCILELPSQLSKLSKLKYLDLRGTTGLLKVRSCLRMEEIISEVSEVANVVGISNPSPFAKLERLHLEHLPDLKSIYWDALPFPCLREIRVSSCPKLKKLPLNCDSAKGNQINIAGTEKWWTEIVKTAIFGLEEDIDLYKIP